MPWEDFSLAILHNTSVLDDIVRDFDLVLGPNLSKDLR